MKWYHYALSGLALAAVGFTFGRYATPDKVVEIERVKTVTVEKEDIRAKERIAALTAEIETLKLRTHRERTTVERPDGTRETREVETVDVDRTTDTRETVEVIREVEKVRTVYVDREVLKEKRIESHRPDWRIGAMGVLDVPTLKYGAGAIVERRILGPISLGLWGVSTGQGGLALTLEF
jgi:hypothetical protein